MVRPMCRKARRPPCGPRRPRPAAGSRRPRPPAPRRPATAVASLGAAWPPAPGFRAPAPPRRGPGAPARPARPAPGAAARARSSARAALAPGRAAARTALSTSLWRAPAPPLARPAAASCSSSSSASSGPALQPPAPRSALSSSTEARTRRSAAWGSETRLPARSPPQGPRPPVAWVSRPGRGHQAQILRSGQQMKAGTGGPSTPTCPGPSVPADWGIHSNEPHPTQILPAWGRGPRLPVGSWAGAADWTQAHSQSLLSWADPLLFPPFGEEVGDPVFPILLLLAGLFVPVWGHLPGTLRVGAELSRWSIAQRRTDVQNSHRARAGLRQESTLAPSSVLLGSSLNSCGLGSQRNDEQKQGCSLGTTRQAGPDNHHDLGGLRSTEIHSAPQALSQAEGQVAQGGTSLSEVTQQLRQEILSFEAPPHTSCPLGEASTTEASVSWALPECPSHHFPHCPGGVLFSSSHVTSSERLKTPPWSTVWNSAHQSLGTTTIQRGTCWAP